MKIALLQFAPKLQKTKLADFKARIEKIDADLIVLPELSLNGYLLKDAVFEDAYTLSELQEFAKLSEKKDIVFGCVFRDKHKIFNSAVYCSKAEIKHIHHKNILPNYGLFQEARFFFEGESIESFQTSFGEVMVVICEEMFSAKTIEKIASKKPHLVLVLSNSPTRGFEENGLVIENQWNSLLSSAAILSGANVAFVNRVGFEDGLGFWGGSRFINPKGEVICKAELFDEEVLYSEVDQHLSKTQKYLLRIK